MRLVCWCYSMSKNKPPACGTETQRLWFLIGQVKAHFSQHLCFLLYSLSRKDFVVVKYQCPSFPALPCCLENNVSHWASYSQPAVLLSLPHSTGLQVCVQKGPSFLPGLQGFELRYSSLHSKHSYQLNHPPRPLLKFSNFFGDSECDKCVTQSLDASWWSLVTYCSCRSIRCLRYRRTVALKCLVEKNGGTVASAEPQP